MLAATFFSLLAPGLELASERWGSGGGGGPASIFFVLVF